MLFHKISFMFTLQVGTPFFNNIVEFLFLIRLRIFQNLDGFGVAYSLEIIFENKIQLFQKSHAASLSFWLQLVFIFLSFCQKFKIVFAMFQDILQYIFYKIFCQIHVLVKIAESNFRLDHPEFSQVTRSIRVFSPESRAKGIYLPESHSKSFCFQLSRNC